MINFDEATEENTQEHNPNWLQIPRHWWFWVRKK